MEVKFYKCTKAEYDATTPVDGNLYFITDTKKIYLGTNNIAELINNTFEAINYSLVNLVAEVADNQFTTFGNVLFVASDSPDGSANTLWTVLVKKQTGNNASVIAIDHEGNTYSTGLNGVTTFTWNKALIQVVDNLTSTDTNKALSANQGKVLNDTKLSLTGGTMTGTINFSTTSAINQPSDTSYIDIIGGQGGQLSLHGKWETDYLGEAILQSNHYLGTKSIIVNGETGIHITQDRIKQISDKTELIPMCKDNDYCIFPYVQFTISVSPTGSADDIFFVEINKISSDKPAIITARLISDAKSLYICCICDSGDLLWKLVPVCVQDKDWTELTLNTDFITEGTIKYSCKSGIVFIEGNEIALKAGTAGNTYVMATGLPTRYSPKCEVHGTTFKQWGKDFHSMCWIGSGETFITSYQSSTLLDYHLVRIHMSYPII